MSQSKPKPTKSETASKTSALVVGVALASLGIGTVRGGEPLAGGLMLLAAAGLVGVYVYFDDKGKKQPDIPFTAEQIEALSRLTASRIEELVDKQTKDESEEDTNEFAPSSPSRTREK